MKALLIALIAVFFPVLLPAVTVSPEAQVIVRLDVSYIERVRDFSDPALAARIAPHSQLIGLNITGQTKAGPATAEAIHHLQDLKYLVIGGEPWLDRPMTLSPEFLAALTQSPLPITYLSLYHSTVDDQQLEQLSQATPLLEILDLSGSVAISDAGILAILKNCPHLKMIRLGSVERLGGETHETLKPPISEALIQEMIRRGIEVER